LEEKKVIAQSRVYTTCIFNVKKEKQTHLVFVLHTTLEITCKFHQSMLIEIIPQIKTYHFYRNKSFNNKKHVFQFTENIYVILIIM